MTANVKEIENMKDLYKELDDTEEPVILYCYYSFCVACIEGMPGFLKLAESMPNAKFLKAEVEDVKGIADYFYITHIPTIIAIKDQGEKDRFTGKDPGDLRKFVENAIH